MNFNASGGSTVSGVEVSNANATFVRAGAGRPLPTAARNTGRALGGAIR